VLYQLSYTPNPQRNQRLGLDMRGTKLDASTQISTQTFDIAIFLARFLERSNVAAALIAAGGGSQLFPFPNDLA
jgi:hypothetical protein